MIRIRRPRILRLSRAFCQLTLCSVFFLVPLLFQTTRFEYNSQVYDVPKQTAWAVLLTGFICSSFLLGRRRWTWPSVLLSVLLLGVWLSCLRAVNLGVALAYGLIASLLIGMPFVAGRLLDSRRSLQRAILCLLAGGTLAVVYALAQRMEWDPLLAGLVGLPQQYRIGSSLGSPARLALYVAGLFPLLTACFLSLPWGSRRGLLTFIGIAFAFLLFSTGNRMAFLTALLGSLYLMVWALVGGRGGRSGFGSGMSGRWNTAMVGLLCLLFAAGVVWSPPDAQSEISVDKEIARASWLLTRDHALLGVGSGNWGIIFPLYHPREYQDEIVRQSGPFPPDALRIWGEWGILGGIGFLGFTLWLLLAGLWKPANGTGDNRAWIAGSIGGVTGLFICTFFGSTLHIPAMHCLFWALAAIALAAMHARKAEAEVQPNPTRWMLVYRAAGVCVLLALGTVMLGRVAMPHFMASRLHLNAIWWLGYPKSIPVFERATELVPYHPEIWADFTENCVRCTYNEDRSAPQYKEYALRAAEVGEKALRFLPNEPALIFRYGNALDFQVGRPWEKLVAYRRAAELSPGTAAFHVAFGRAYMYLSGWSGIPRLTMLLGKKRALDEWKTALALEPDNAAAAYNLALDARNNQKPQEALDYLTRILRTYPHHQKALELLQELGYRMEDLNTKRNLERIAAYWQAQVEENPLDPANYFLAGEAYEKLGKQELATLMYKRAFLKDPKYVPAIRKLKARGVSLERLLREGEPALED